MANSDDKTTSGPKAAASSGGGGPMGPPLTDVTESAVDLSAYPVMVEQVGPSGPAGAVMTPTGAAPAAGFDATVASALRDVLGWNPRANDAKGFVGALTQSFDLKDVEGHVEATWKPRSYAVASDLSGGITGAQASLYSRAKWAIQQAQPLLDGLYSLAVEADPQDVEALRSSVAVQLDKLVDAFGAPGGPVFAVVELRFEALLGHPRVERVEAGVAEAVRRPAVPVEDLRLGGPDPDQVGGLLGSLRDILGLSTRADLVNTVDEEQNLTNFRILADYVVGLRQSWVDNRRFFTRQRGGAKPFFGTQLVLLSRQLSVIAESVNELRRALDSVFIGPLERAALEIQPKYFFRENVEEIDLFVIPSKTLVGIEDDPKWKHRLGEPIFVEELLSWIQDFASTEGPQIIQDGGKLAVRNLFLPATRRLYEIVSGARRPLNWRTLPQGYLTPRVQRSMQELEGQLLELVRLARPIDHKVLAGGSFRPVRE